jgi:hypothetical protein
MLERRELAEKLKAVLPELAERLKAALPGLVEKLKAALLGLAEKLKAALLGLAALTAEARPTMPGPAEIPAGRARDLPRTVGGTFRFRPRTH